MRVVILAVGMLALAIGAVRTGNARETHALGRSAGMRLAFTRDHAGYVARGSGYRLTVAPHLTVLRYFEGFGDVDQWFREEEFRMQLVGAAPLAAQRMAEERRDWVGFTGVYPRIDLECGGSAERLEYRFVIAPGADPGAIRLRISGGGKPRLAADGALVIATPAGEARILRPVTQDAFDGEWLVVPGTFAVVRDGLVEFRPLR